MASEPQYDGIVAQHRDAKCCPIHLSSLASNTAMGYFLDRLYDLVLNGQGGTGYDELNATLDYGTLLVIELEYRMEASTSQGEVAVKQ